MSVTTSLSDLIRIEDNDFANSVFAVVYAQAIVGKAKIFKGLANSNFRLKVAISHHLRFPLG